MQARPECSYGLAQARAHGSECALRAPFDRATPRIQRVCPNEGVCATTRGGRTAASPFMG